MSEENQLPEFDLRTALQWLGEHGLAPNAECWVLSGDTVEPVIGVTPTPRGNCIMWTRPVWAEPSPSPLTFTATYDILVESYSGGGRLIWEAQPRFTYRGSHVVDPEKSVFFLFLPTAIQLIESHEEKMEQRKQQARQLTEQIERTRNQDG